MLLQRGLRQNTVPPPAVQAVLLEEDEGDGDDDIGKLRCFCGSFVVSRPLCCVHGGRGDKPDVNHWAIASCAKAAGARSSSNDATQGVADSGGGCSGRYRWSGQRQRVSHNRAEDSGGVCMRCVVLGVSVGVACSHEGRVDVAGGFTSWCSGRVRWSDNVIRLRLSRWCVPRLP